VDHCVETLCTVPCWFVDHAQQMPESTRELCGNLLDGWSHLLCLAIYEPVSRADSDSEAR